MPLTKTELRELLDEPRLAHLAAVSKNGKPHVSAIWYIFEDGKFYFTTRLGRVKGKLIQANPNVSLSIATDERPYRAICAFGKATLVKDDDRKRWLEKLSTRYSEEEGEQYVTRVLKQPDRVVFALVPDRLLTWHYGRDDAAEQDRGVSMATSFT